MAVTVTDPRAIRNRVVDGLHGPIGQLVRRIDQTETVVRVHLETHGMQGLSQDIRNVLADLVRERDAYLAPLLERWEE